VSEFINISDGEEKSPENKNVSSLIVVIVLLSFAIIYSAVCISHWSEAYVDFGDGNYMYISTRIADGLVLYRDIMAPQPPSHLFTGALLVKIGSAFGSPLYAFRAFALLLHLATMLVIFLITKKISGFSLDGLFAAFLYLVIPVGFWWAQGYQSEGLLIFFLITSFYFFIDFKDKGMITASLIGSLSAFTNMTAVPYLFFNNVYLVIRKRKQFLYYAITMISMGIIGVMIMEIHTGGHYLENVFFNQVGTFPNPIISGESVLSYSFAKIVNEGKDIMTWEGGYVLFAILGIILFMTKGKKRDNRREYIGWYAIISLGSIIYVSKGGTMEYIFTIGEPFVVIFFAYVIGLLWRGPLQGGKFLKNFKWNDTSGLAGLFALVFLFIATFYIGFFYIRQTLHGSSYELSHGKVLEVKEIIEQYTKPGDPILAPPFYAFITGRNVVEEYSENYIWTIKYVNEMYVDKKPGDGVQKALDIAAKLKEKKVPLILLDMAQTAKLAPIKKQIDENYKALNVWNGSNILRTLNTNIGFYVPVKD
jgi:hypothetical protein